MLIFCIFFMEKLKPSPEQQKMSRARVHAYDLGNFDKKKLVAELEI